MKAIVCEMYGPPEALELREVDKPALEEDGVLVRLRASSVNPADLYAVTGVPYVVRAVLGGLLKPKNRFPGVDFAGTVEAVGSAVRQFKPGDEVFGARNGAWAEYVHVRESRYIVPKPANVSFEQAGVVATAGCTALQGLRDHGQLRPGQRVLINGASGGVGTFAVQIAKSLGAEVTAVCSTRNVELVGSLGADQVIDYTREDFTRSGQRYDLLLDVAGSRSPSEYRRVLAERATIVGVGVQKGNRWSGPIWHIVKRRVASIGASQRMTSFMARYSKEHLAMLQELMATGKLRPVVDRTYPLDEVAKALNYLGEGHAQGKILLTM